MNHYPKNILIHLGLALIIGLTIGMGIDYFRNVKLAPLLCALGSVFFALAQRRQYKSQS